MVKNYETQLDSEAGDTRAIRWAVATFTCVGVSFTCAQSSAETLTLRKMIVFQIVLNLNKMQSG